MKNISNEARKKIEHFPWKFLNSGKYDMIVRVAAMISTEIVIAKN
jgi:hypothetical protein